MEKNIEAVPERAIALKPVGKSSRKFNWSSYFLLPIILPNGNRTKGFINSYVYSTEEDLKEDNCRLYIHLEEVSDRILSHPRYISNVETSKGYICSFDINKYKSDVDLFIQGKYSKFSQELKDLLCKNQTVKPEMNSQIYKVLYKTEDKRLEIEELVGQKLDDDAELASSPNIDEEIWDER